MGADVPGAAAEHPSTSRCSEQQLGAPAQTPSTANSPAKDTQQKLTPAARRALMRATTISTVLAALAMAAVPLLFLHDTAKEVCATLAACRQWLRPRRRQQPHGSTAGNSSSEEAGSAQRSSSGDAAGQEWPLPYVVELTVVPMAVVLLRQWSHEPSRAACLQILASIVVQAYVRCARATLQSIPSGVASLLFGAIELLCAGMRLMAFAALTAATPTWLDVALAGLSGSTWLVATLGLVVGGTAALMQGFDARRTAEDETNATAAA